MSGINTGRAPKTDAEWARDVARRVSTLENPRAARAGQWVLSTRSDDGALIASLDDGGTVVLSEPQAVADAQAMATADRWNNVNRQLGAQQDAINGVIADLANIRPVVTGTPAWVSNLDDMPTFPRSSIVPTLVPNVSTTSIACGELAHSHVVDMPYVKPVASNFLGTSTGTIYLAPIIVDREGLIDRFRFISGPSSWLYQIDEYFVGLYVFNPDTAALEKLWQSDNLESMIGTTDLELEVDMGLGQQCTPGQVLFAAHMQRVPSVLGQTRNFAAIRQSGVARPASVLLRGATYLVQGQTTMPSTIPFPGTLVVDNGYLPWMAVSVTNDE